MKNKEKYNLNELTVGVSSSVNGCGKAIDPKHITIRYKDETVYEETSYDSVIRVILRWLENE